MPGPRPRLLARDDLDRFRCDVPGCTACAAEGRVYFRARCHPRAALFVCYERDADEGLAGASAEVGTIVLQCPRCDREVARVLVGARPA